jgi:hypothetical protein
MVEILAKRMQHNLQISKKLIDDNFTSHLYQVRLGLDMLDSTHYQAENGVQKIHFVGDTIAVTSNELSFNLIKQEVDEPAHNFRMRPDIILTGEVAFVHMKCELTGFNIKPYSFEEDSLSQTKSFCLTAVSSSNDDKSFKIIVNLDNKKRVSSIQIPNINFMEFPSTRREIYHQITRNMDMEYIADFRKMSNNLALELTKSELTKLKSVGSINNDSDEELE